MALQTTIKNRVVCEGVGVHTGMTSTVTLLPAPENTGIIFRRTDHPGMAGVVPARFDRVTDTRLGTTIGNVYGVKVHTVEHLMAAIVGCDIHPINNRRILEYLRHHFHCDAAGINAWCGDALRNLDVYG